MAESTLSTERKMLEAKERGEVNVFARTEASRAVKDPRYDRRLLTQTTWGQLATAQVLDHVEGVEDVQWRKGYGEDADAIEVLEKKSL
jgi:hypothetical protein